jgi:hypothetical protein
LAHSCDRGTVQDVIGRFTFGVSRSLAVDDRTAFQSGLPFAGAGVGAGALGALVATVSPHAAVELNGKR